MVLESSVLTQGLDCLGNDPENGRCTCAASESRSISIVYSKQLFSLPTLLTSYLTSPYFPIKWLKTAGLHLKIINISCLSSSSSMHMLTKQLVVVLESEVLF